MSARGAGLLPVATKRSLAVPQVIGLYSPRSLRRSVTETNWLWRGSID
jgi:hypothetical protein